MGDRQDDHEARACVRVGCRNKAGRTILALITADGRLSIPKIVVSNDQAGLWLGKCHASRFTSSIRRDEPFPDPSRRASLPQSRPMWHLLFDRFAAPPP